MIDQERHIAVWNNCLQIIENNIDPQQFSTWFIFHSLTQMSPASYIVNVRINAAKTLLGTTDRRISDIASDVGFFDHSHFIRTFKRIVGATPAKYRRHLTMWAHRGDEP